MADDSTPPSDSSATPSRDPRTDPLARKGIRSPWRKRRKGAHHATGQSALPAEPRQGPRHSTFYILPNLFTSASLFLALYAITQIAEGIVNAPTGTARAFFETACWCILLAAVCDAIDGPVARWTRTATNFGLQYDSLADVVAFGVTPAFLMFANLRIMDRSLLPDYASQLALGACSLYAICAAIRLARFNVQATTTEKSYFTGLPSPGAAGTVVTAYLFVEWFNGLQFVENIEDRMRLTRWMHRSVLLMMVGLAFLMVSNVRFSKLRNIMPMFGTSFNALVAMVVVVCALMVLQKHMAPILFSVFLMYIVISIWATARRPAAKVPPADPAPSP